MIYTDDMPRNMIDLLRQAARDDLNKRHVTVAEIKAFILRKKAEHDAKKNK